MIADLSDQFVFFGDGRFTGFVLKRGAVEPNRIGPVVDNITVCIIDHGAQDVFLCFGGREKIGHGTHVVQVQGIDQVFSQQPGDHLTPLFHLSKKVD